MVLGGNYVIFLLGKLYGRQLCDTRMVSQSKAYEERKPMQIQDIINYYLLTYRSEWFLTALSKTVPYIIKLVLQTLLQIERYITLNVSVAEMDARLIL